MEKLLSKLKTLGISSLALSLFFAFALSACSPTENSEGDADATEETMEAEEAHDHAEGEGHEHPDGEHPAGGEHPSSDTEETESDSTAVEGEHPEGDEHPSED